MSQNLSQQFQGKMKSPVVYLSSRTPISVQRKVMKTKQNKKTVKRIRKYNEVYQHWKLGYYLHQWQSFKLLNSIIRWRWLNDKLNSKPGGCWGLWENKPDLASKDLEVVPCFPFTRLCGAGSVTNLSPMVRELNTYHDCTKNKIKLMRENVFFNGYFLNYLVFLNILLSKRWII